MKIFSTLTSLPLLWLSILPLLQLHSIASLLWACGLYNDIFILLVTHLAGLITP